MSRVPGPVNEPHREPLPSRTVGQFSDAHAEVAKARRELEEIRRHHGSTGRSGTFSMAAGEYVSMRVQREGFESAIEMERREIAEEPEAEQQEVEVILRAQGVPPEEAAKIAP